MQSLISHVKVCDIWVNAHFEKPQKQFALVC